MVLKKYHHISNLKLRKFICAIAKLYYQVLKLFAHSKAIDFISMKNEMSSVPLFSVPTFVVSI